jgi:hypothetical protein
MPRKRYLFQYQCPYYLVFNEVKQCQSFLPAAIKANTRDVDESITEPESDLPDVKNTANAVDESVTEPESVEAQTPIEFTRYYEALLANEARLAQ